MGVEVLCDEQKSGVQAIVEDNHNHRGCSVAVNSRFKVQGCMRLLN